MGRAATLIGIDIGSTTTSAVVAEARLREAGPGGRVALSDVREVLRSPLVFTPFRGAEVDGGAVLALVDGWLAAAGVEPEALFGGGALITGLAARSPGAPALAERLRERLGRALVATARDPRLESWLAFMGNVAELSRRAPDVPFLNVDIGGGTANLALGVGGEVLRTGCLAIGARHVQVEPGTLRVVRLSPEARAILGGLSIRVSEGEDMAPAAVDALCDVWIAALEQAVTRGTAALATGRFGRWLVEAPLEPPGAGPAGPSRVDASRGDGAEEASRGEGAEEASRGEAGGAGRAGVEEASRGEGAEEASRGDGAEEASRGEAGGAGRAGVEEASRGDTCGEAAAPVLVYSGGVGEMVYRLARGEALGGTAPFGDLGAVLAERVLASPVLGAGAARWAPEGGGRAVAYGLLLHATEVSGATLHLPRPDVLPLRDLPIVGAVSPASADADIASAVALARRAGPGGCVEVALPDSRADTVRSMAARLGGALGGAPFPAERPLVLLVSRNVGKVLGACLTDWGRGAHREGVVVLDEVRRPGACFLHVGRPHGGVVPVSFFGMR